MNQSTNTNAMNSTALYAATTLVAGCSLLYELILAQTLAASLGGTVLRYATTIGLFTFSLGLGAFAFSNLRTRLPPLRTLAVIQVLLAVVGFGGPYLIQAVDPTQFTFGPRLFSEILSYAPVVTIGLLSGFELPLLIEVGGRENQFRILAADYVGMFIGCLLFPFFLLPRLGIFETSFVVSVLNFGAAIFFAFASRGESWMHASNSYSKDDAPPSAPMNSQPSKLALTLFLVFVLSFCSLGYEILIAKTLTDLTGNEVMSQSLTIGLFLLGMGIGSWLCARRDFATPLKTLFDVEVTLTVVGALCVCIAYAVATLYLLYISNHFANAQISETVLIWILTPVSFAVGVLSGFELPLLMKSLELQRVPSKGLPLGFSYLGALVAGFAMPLFFFPALGNFRSAIAIALLNLVCCLGLLRSAGSKVADRRGLAVLFATLALVAGVKSSNWIEQTFLKTSYFELHLSKASFETFVSFKKILAALDPIHRIETRYQTIDLVDTRESRIDGLDPDLVLYLNRQPQFSLSNWRSYHDSFAFGPVNLAGHAPKRVLVLGGGDGFLAGRLLRVSGIDSITLVELDPIMIQLAREHVDFLDVNDDALNNPKVKVVVDDAFRFVRTQKETYDAIFVDFPYPMSFELSKLYSVEFYQAAKSRLASGGFLILDAPIPGPLDGPVARRPAPRDILLSTVRAAGFKTGFFFGPRDPFLYLTVEETVPRFRYENLPSDIAGRAFVNLTDLDFIHDEPMISAENVNSIYKPKWFR